MMLSSSRQARDAARCRELGISAYLTKPIQQSSLLDAIMTAITAPALPRQTTGAQPAASAAVPPHAGRRLSILVAEDNVVNQRLVSRVVGKWGHTAVIANNGREALAALEHAALENHPFDLVLMDVQMPEMGGLETTRAIREREKLTGRHTAIVAMTAHALKGDRERCLDAGMDDYIPKPIQAEDLARAIGENVAELAGQAVSNDRAVNAAALLARFRGDADLLKELVDLFLQESPGILSEIERAIAARDAAALHMAAHTLKGSVGNFMAHEAAEAALRLEKIARSGDLEDAGPAYTALVELCRQLSASLQESVKIANAPPGPK
jgi:CheY-like chemotaxis protein